VDRGGQAFGLAGVELAGADLAGAALAGAEPAVAGVGVGCAFTAVSPSAAPPFWFPALLWLDACPPWPEPAVAELP